MPKKDDQRGRGEADGSDYVVYGKRGLRSAPRKKGGKGEARQKADSEPDYTVYKSRRRLRDRLGAGGRGDDVEGMRRRGSRKDRERGRGRRGTRPRRRWIRIVLVAMLGWLLVSLGAFLVSAQIQKGKLPDSARAELTRNPLLLAGSNVLILGGDTRGTTVGRNEVGGGGPPRSDTMMVVHAGFGTFRKLSIPRDSYATIPGCGTQKINAALACNTSNPLGNPGSSIVTVEDFLGIDVDHVVLVDFEGFLDFIDALGGVRVDLPNRVCGRIGGGRANGGQGVNLKPGPQTLRALQALALARLRVNLCDPSETDIDRAARQQLILNGVRAQLLRPIRLPITFLRAPLIGWNAPKAIISDMGGLTLSQLAIAAVFGGGKTNVLKPSAPGPGGSLIIPQSECLRGVEKLTGRPPSSEPSCSPL